MIPHSEVSHKKFAERLERQSHDGHHWDQVPEMLREAARRIRELEHALTKQIQGGPSESRPAGT